MQACYKNETKKCLFFAKNDIVCAETFFFDYFFFVNKGIICAKPIFAHCEPEMSICYYKKNSIIFFHFILTFTKMA